MADESPPPSPTSATPPPHTTGGGFRWEPPTAEQLQAAMPGYTIEKLLGRGGMGAVYRGVQTNLDRPVAIKILPPGVEKEDPSFAERFKSEARLMAKLMHPGVVAVFDFGTTAAGQLYFAMEYVDGSDVSQMIAAQGRLEPEHALAIIAHMCDALGAAHELGIVHRDIKPANVLINTKGQVKIADFGLAKIEEPGGHGLTKTGYAMGTPDFVSPEALTLGTAIDGRADIYALGVMLYQMLTGNIPRGAFKPAAVLRPTLDPRFDPIINKAMQHDRAERYQSAAELRRDLDVILTVPLVQNDAPTQAAIPVAQMAQPPGQRSAAQKPMGKPPQPRSDAGVPFGAAQPARKESPPAGKSARTTPEPPAKSKTPLFIGLGAAAAIGIGAFAMFSGGEKTKPKGPPATSSGAKVTQNSGQHPKTTPGTVAPPSKPAPAPVSSSPSLPVSKSSDPQFPPGQWVKVLTKVEDLPPALRSRQPSGMKDGWIKAADSGEQLRLPPQLTGNYAMRAHFRRRADNKRASYLNLRAYGSDKQRYQLFLSDGGFLSLQSLQAGKFISLASVQSQRKFMPGETFQLSLGVVGARLVMRLGSELMRSHVDTTHASGTGFLHLQDDVRDIEVINLDGLPETEALKILGVDEKDNDLRKPTTLASASPAPTTAKPSASPGSTSPSLPASKSQTFPPGQWVKLYRKAEDLPEDLRKPDIKFENGWIRFTAGKAHRIPLLSGINNCGIRAKFERVTKSPNKPSTFILRGGGPNKSEYYRLYFGNQLFIASKPVEAETTYLFQTPVIQSSQGLGEFTMEFAAFGSLLIGRFGSEILRVVKDADLTGDVAYITGAEDIRDIEVINLDGLPEAEALRLLGVDEKGNDLRALAAKQEEMQKAQAAQADAMAAIPELKTLHEQFVKLQAERVTAPFEADVAKLNSGYLGGLDRKIGEMKQKGDLDGVLALEEEKKLVTGARTPSSAVVPMTTNADGGVRAPDDTPDLPVLKDLRQIYRDAYAKLEASRAVNLKLLTDPLDARLRQIEATLTQQDRIAHAKTVREYREGLGKSSSEVPFGASQQLAPAASKSATAETTQNGLKSGTTLKKFPPGDDRKAAEWALDLGGFVSIRDGRDTRNITKKEELPKSSFEVLTIRLKSGGTGAVKPSIAFTGLAPLAGLRSLENFEANGLPVTDEETPILASLPNLRGMSIITDKQFTGSALSMLKECAKLQSVNFGSSGLRREGIEQLGQLGSLTTVSVSTSELTDDDVAPLGNLKKLTKLHLGRNPLSLEAWRHLKGLPLISIQFTPEPGKAREWAKELASLFPAITQSMIVIQEGAVPNVEDIEAQAAFPLLKELSIVSSDTDDQVLEAVSRMGNLQNLEVTPGLAPNPLPITDAGIAHLLNLKSLNRLVLRRTQHLTPAALTSLARLKSLKNLELSECPQFEDAAITAFKKERPDVALKR